MALTRPRTQQDFSKTYVEVLSAWRVKPCTLGHDYEARADSLRCPRQEKLTIAKTIVLKVYW
jgi:hypothetical protein